MEKILCMASSDLLSLGAVDLFDRAFYQQLSGLLGSDMTKLVTDFFDSCNRFETRLVEITGGADKCAFRELCHEIKGSAAMLGFTGLSRLAAEWENGVISGELPSVSEVTTRFKTMVEATRATVAGIPVLHQGGH